MLIYMDSGTSATRAWLIDRHTPIDAENEKIGTKDSAISGSNDILLSGMLHCCEKLLSRHGLQQCDIDEIWASGMVTNTFGIVEVDHVSTPADARKLLDTAWRHQEDNYFCREIMLIRGVKTAQPDQQVTIENIDRMNNVRGEEIEAMGLSAGGILPPDMDCVFISPGSNTHALLIRNGVVLDILSTFTGEINHALRKETILSGELANKPVNMPPEHVLRGFNHLSRYGFSRAIYIIHATK
ncbi:MAG: 2-dehydro-3-deoxygalactonokinase, partial [Peptococcaceae bacterium]|nr:2-dehydro-3-deoxygalactonokinase [Peptococcaceae bacterium]